jgi:hypothetical protein
LSAAVLLPSFAAAQTAPAGPPSCSIGPIKVTGLVDGYYSLNLNHPASKNNAIRNFDVKANQMSLNMAKIGLDLAPSPVGFKIDVAGGRAMDLFHATEPGGVETYKHLMQAYISLKPSKLRGVQFDFGKFVTSAGAEVTETHLNWNYSRSLLYANGPYYHFGARVTMPVHEHFTAGFQLVNGWNNVEDNNGAKTVGFTGALTTSKVSWFNNYYVGNEKTDTDAAGVRINAPGLRHFYDTVVAVSPIENLSFLFNFDYGVDKLPGAIDSTFYGYSVATRVLPHRLFAISPRYDWYRDRDGFITGTAQKLQEFTLTGDIRTWNWFLTRLEYRRDWSDQPFFDRGNETRNWRSQNTFLIGFVAYFGQ